MKPNVTENIIKGDVQTFERFFRYYSRELYYYALGLCCDPALAKDSVQDGFLYLWENRKKLKKDTSPIFYLRTTVRNNVLNNMRHRKIRSRHEDNIIRDSAWSADHEDDELNEKIEVVKGILDSLPEACRRAFVMAVVEGMSYSDTAVELGVSVNTVKTHVRVGYKKIRAGVARLGSKDIALLIILSFSRFFF